MEAIVGVGRLYIAAAETALPTSRSDAAALRAGTFPDFDFIGKTTDDGVTLSNTVNMEELKSGNAARAEDDYVTGFETSVSATLTRLSAERVAELIHGDNEVALDDEQTVTPGGQRRVKKFALVIVGSWTEGGEDAVFGFAKVAPTADFELSLANSWAEVDTEFKVYEVDGSDDYVAFIPPAA